MATRLEDEFDPTRINAPDAAYPAGSLKDETTPGVSDDGTPLASRVGNDWQGFSQSALGKAGISANGQPDSVTNPQILQAIEKMYNDGDSQLAGGNIWPLSSQDTATTDLPTNTAHVRFSGGDFSEIELFTMIGVSGETGIFSGTPSNVNLSTKPYSAEIGGTFVYLVRYKKLPILSLDLTDFYCEPGEDVTLPLRAAVSLGYKVTATGDDYNVETFDQVLSDGITCAVNLGDFTDFSCVDGGKIIGVTGSVSNAIFGCDTQNARVDLSNSNFGGTTRHRAYHCSSNIEIEYENISNVNTDIQSIISLSVCKTRIYKTIRLGLEITETTPYSTTLTINPIDWVIEEGYDFNVSDVKVYCGTEDIAGALVIKRIPIGGVLDNCAALNIGKSNTEGYDIDGVGTGAILSNLVSLNSNIEYKQASGGTYELNREVTASNWSVWNCSLGAGISVRSSLIGTNFLVYNQLASFPYFIADLGSPLGQPIQITNMRYVYSDTVTLPGMMRMVGTSPQSKISLLNVKFVIDPVVLDSAPSTKIPFLGINVGGSDWADISLSDVYIDACEEDQIQVRSPGATNGRRLSIKGARFGDCDDSCIDIGTFQDASIQVDHWPDNIGDRAIRSSAVTNVKVDAPLHPTLVNSMLTVPNFVVNNSAIGTFGVGNPPDFNVLYPIGVNVTNTDDDTVWLRVRANFAASDFIQIA